MKQKETKQRLFEVMQRLDKTFKPKMNEDWDSHHPDAPWNQKDDEVDEYDGWELDRHNDVVLNSQHSGTYVVDWEFLIPDENEFETLHQQIIANPRDPEVHKKIDELVNEFLRSGHTFNWTYQDPDFDEPSNYSDNGNTEWMDYIN